VLDRFTSATPDELLQIYLNDHRAGAVAAHALASRARAANGGNEFGEFLDEFVPALEEDIDRLDAVFDRCSMSKNCIKLGAARLGAALGQLKLNGRLTEYSPLSRVIEFEALRVGVLGKQQLWRTIAALPSDHPAVLAVDTSWLIARAETQAQRLGELGERASAIAFTAEEQ
jgi:hypothetical protein